MTEKFLYRSFFVKISQFFNFIAKYKDTFPKTLIKQHYYNKNIKNNQINSPKWLKLFLQQHILIKFVCGVCLYVTMGSQITFYKGISLKFSVFLRFFVKNALKREKIKIFLIFMQNLF